MHGRASQVRDNGRTFSGRAGIDRLRDYEDRYARPVQCSVGLSRSRRPPTFYVLVARVVAARRANSDLIAFVGGLSLSASTPTKVPGTALRVVRNRNTNSAHASVLHYAIAADDVELLFTVRRLAGQSASHAIAIECHFESVSFKPGLRIGGRRSRQRSPSPPAAGTSLRSRRNAGHAPLLVARHFYHGDRSAHEAKGGDRDHSGAFHVTFGVPREG